jgi:Domain of unknown function (DUF4279)
MPSVIFHVSGKQFRPETELAKTKLKPYDIHHVGDFLKRKRGDIVLKHSGFSVDIGPQNNDDLAAQIKVAAKFVKKHFAEIKRLKKADDLCLDFGYCMRFDEDGEPVWVQTNQLPPEFLKMCGELKVGIDLSFYYVFTVDKLISHYVRKFKLKRPKQKHAGKK